MNNIIKIKNEVDCAVIDIEGTIGVAEEWQFGDHDSYVATYERFKESVMRIADVEHREIRVNIRSTGGSVHDALLIYEALRATGAKVVTCCYGYTASAATIVAQAASVGCRLVAPSSLYLIHNSMASVEGNVEELRAEIEMLQKTDERIAGIYASRSGRTVEQMAALMSENGGRGRWLSPEEAIAEGLVDAIDEERSESGGSPSIAERAKRGVKALLRSLGVGIDADVRDRVFDRALDRKRAVESSIIAIEEAQRGVARTETKSVNDPDPVDIKHDPRTMAYDADIRSIRRR